MVTKDPKQAEILRNEGAIHHGGVLGPFQAYMIARGMHTLPLRMRQHCETARVVADWLEKQSSTIERVIYPHAESHPQYALARRQMSMGGGMISFSAVGGEAGATELASRMMSRLETIHYAVSLGHQRSLIYLLPTDELASRPGSSFSLESSALEAYKMYAGSGGVVRFSVGLEDPEDIIADLERVLL